MIVEFGFNQKILISCLFCHKTNIILLRLSNRLRAFSTSLIRAMPELAEVERARKEIEILAKPGVAFISKVVAFEDNIVFAGCTGAEFVSFPTRSSNLQLRLEFQSSAILGKKVISAGRKGKNFYLELDSAPHVGQLSL